MSRTTQGGKGTPLKQSRSASRPVARSPQGRPEERYRRGARRTTAEPLAASWQPDTDDEVPKRRRQRRGLRGLLAIYSWRVYALPVLLVITALVVWDTTKNQPATSVTEDTSSQNEAVLGESGEASPPPEAAEMPVTPVDVNIPTAELPKGAEFTKRGQHSWRVLPGTTPRVGTGGRLYKYTIEVENGIDPAEYGGDDAFSGFIDDILANPKGWTSGGRLSVQRVDPNVTKPDFRISLTTPETTHGPDLCGFSIPYETSCRRLSAGRVVINLARWANGALVFEGDQLSYRQYAINHEVGHAFGLQHEGCKNNGDLAPVMMQQTLGVANDYVARLNNVPGGDRNSVPADGKVCKPNPWPNPQAKSGG